MRNSAADVTRNTAILTLLRVASPALAMIVVLAVSRVLGSEGLGRYTLASTYLTFVTTVTPLGLNAFLMREGARDLAGLPKLFANSVTVAAVLSLLAMPVMLMVGRSLGYDPTTVQVLQVMSLGILPATLLILCDGVFVSRQRSLYVGVYTVADMIVRVGVATLLLRWGYGVTAVVGALAAAQLIALCVAAYCSGRLGAPLRLGFDPSTLRRLLGSAPTFVSITVFATLYWRIDVVMLSTLGTIREVGLYGAAYRIMDLVRILPQSLCMSVYPLVAHAAVTDLKRLRRVGTETLRFLAMVTIPMVVGGTILAGPLLAFTVGEEFRAAGTTLSVLLWTAIPYTFTRYYAYVIVGANHERVDLLLNVVLSAVNIALNVLLIPLYGSVGAAAATLISIVLFGAGQYLYLVRRLPGHLAPLPDMAKPIAAAAVMAVFVWLRRSDHVLVLIGTASVVYGAVLLLTGFVSVRDLRLLRHGDVAAVLDSSQTVSTTP